MSDLSVIQLLLDEQEAEIEAAKRAQEEKEKAIVEKLLSEMKTFLGDFWTLLEKRASETGTKYNYKVEWESNDRARILYSIPALDEAGLAPILIRWDGYSLHSGYRSHGDRFRVMGRSYGELKEAIHAARLAHPEYTTKKIEERLEHYRKELAWVNSQYKDEAEIVALLEEYKKEFPEREDKALEALEYWKTRKREKEERLEEERRAQEAREAAQALRKTLETAYIVKLAEYMQAHDEASSRNEALAMMNQEIEDSTPYTVYQLTYAVIGEWTEDGETFRELETRSVYVLDEDPDEDGYYRIGDNRRIKYIHGVSVEPIETVASKGILSRHIDYEGFSVHFQPGTSDETIKKILSGVEKLPKEPEAPEELEVSDRYSKRNYYAMARKYLETGKIGEASDDWTAPDDLAF